MDKLGFKNDRTYPSLSWPIKVNCEKTLSLLTPFSFHCSDMFHFSGWCGWAENFWIGRWFGFTFNFNMVNRKRDKSKKIMEANKLRKRVTGIIFATLQHTGYCFTQYNIFCTKLDSKCVTLKSTCGKHAVNSYGRAYSMIRKLGSGVGLFVTCEVYHAGEPRSFGRPTGHPAVHNRNGT